MQYDNRHMDKCVTVLYIFAHQTLTISVQLSSSILTNGAIVWSRPLLSF